MIPTGLGIALIVALVIGFFLWGAVSLPAQSAKRQLRGATAAKLRAAATRSGDRVTFGHAAPSSPGHGDVWVFGEHIRVWNAETLVWAHNVGPRAEAIRNQVRYARDSDAGLITYEQVARWLSPEIRAALDGQGRPDDEIRHGTEAGFQRHFARPELACPTCLSAHRAYMRQRTDLARRARDRRLGRA